MESEEWGLKKANKKRTDWPLDENETLIINSIGMVVDHSIIGLYS